MFSGEAGLGWTTIIFYDIQFTGLSLTEMKLLVRVSKRKSFSLAITRARLGQSLSPVIMHSDRMLEIST